MQTTVAIDDIDDPRLNPYRDLRHRGDDRGFIAEGHLIVERLLRSNHLVHSVLKMTHAKDISLAGLARDVPIYTCDKAILSQVAGYAFHRGVLAHAAVPELTSWRNHLASDDIAPLGLGLLHVTDAENVGGLLRTAAAFGFRDIWLGDGTVSPFSRRAIRVSMAAVFRLRFIDARSAVPILESCDQRGVETIATTLDRDAPCPGDGTLLQGGSDKPSVSSFDRKSVLWLGNEADGLPEAFQAGCRRRVRLSMNNDIDSLNVAAAGAIFMHQLSRGQSI
ncbi:MAG: RNA methyltransferase [Planctomycetota bacterium]